MQRLAIPLMRAFSPMLLLRAELASNILAQPRDEPRTVVSGHDPDNLLLVGGGVVVGYGVLTHELALGGHLARQVAMATRRGIDLDVVADSSMTMYSVPDVLSKIKLARYDGVVLALGVTDSVRLTSVRAWRQQLCGALEVIFDQTAANVPVFVVGIQPVRTVTTFDNFFGSFAELHSRALNRETKRVCAKQANATFIPFDPPKGDPERYRSSATYGAWAHLISPALIDVLQDRHPIDNFTI